MATIYLDNAATTKPFKEAVAFAANFLDEDFYNPSALYSEGLKVKACVEDARKAVSRAFGGNFDVIFTACGSESDNMAIKSFCRRGNAVTTLGEHSAVNNAFLELKQNGYDARFAAINKDGSVNIDNLLSLVDKNTAFVSVVHVNNETGAINDINAIAKKVKEIAPRAVFHSDGVQAFLKIPFKPSEYIDLYSASAHKINAIKGVGAIFKNKKLNTLKPLIIGGGQEGGLRSGTENVFGIKTFEYAANRHFNALSTDLDKICDINAKFRAAIDKSIFEFISPEAGSPYIITLAAKNLKGEVLQHMMESYGVIIGTGSACSSKHPVSRMLLAAGIEKSVAGGVVRISFSSETNLSDALFAAEKLNECGATLKRTIEK